MNSPYEYQLKHDTNGRIVEKTETIAGESISWAYAYDTEGRLTEARLDDRLICKCEYDRKGRRSRDLLPIMNGNTYRRFEYHWKDNRLVTAGNNRYTHDNAGFRFIWNSGGNYTTYKYEPDGRLIEVHQEDNNIRYAFDHDDNGQRIVKYSNGQIIEAYKWLDLVRLADFYDGQHIYEFAYEENSRTPFAMRRDDGFIAYLFYDQVGSLRVVADSNGTMIKSILYDPFGSVIKDTNPSLHIPLGFAGGLHDRDIGFVRFGWRDYDPYTARWTAPDPMGDAGGDEDWYGYCLDDPVNGVDPLGLSPYWTAAQQTYYQYAPAISNGWRALVGNLDGAPGFQDIPGAVKGWAINGFEWYGAQVDKNLAKQRHRKKDHTQAAKRNRGKDVEDKREKDREEAYDRGMRERAAAIAAEAEATSRDRRGDGDGGNSPSQHDAVKTRREDNDGNAGHNNTSSGRRSSNNYDSGHGYSRR